MTAPAPNHHTILVARAVRTANGYELTRYETGGLLTPRERAIGKAMAGHACIVEDPAAFCEGVTSGIAPFRFQVGSEFIRVADGWRVEWDGDDTCTVWLSVAPEAGKPIASSDPTGCTLFWDMHSGGGTKVKPFDKIYIEAPEEIARAEFERLTQREPDHVTCDCCGEDYLVSEYKDIAQASGFHRGCGSEDYVERSGKGSVGTYLTVEEHIARPDVVFVPVSEIGKHATLHDWKRLQSDHTAHRSEVRA